MESAQTKWPYVERVLGVSVAASASLLAGAHIFEAIGYAPCQLCLDQREAHWAGLSVALIALGAAIFFNARRVAAAAIGATALVYAVSMGLAFYHTGVEFKFWPGPATCGGGGPIEIGAGGLGAALEEGPSGPSCDEAPWQFLGISMAGYNFLVSSGLFVLCLSAAVNAARSARQSAVAEFAS